MTPRLFAGLMSGTSLDAIDAVLVRFDGESHEVVAWSSQPLPAALREALHALQQPGGDEFERAALAANELADLSAVAVGRTLAAAGVAASEVVAIGCHGQTVRHDPGRGFTIQLNNPARLVERTGISVVADFRRRDVAAGGQGAPLVPAFHAVAFASPVHRAVVNIGGMANVTDLPPGGPVRGWDTGPGNVLLDEWARRCLGEPFDRDGALAAAGCIDTSRLAAMLADPWFSLLPPKSTGRDRFNGRWIDRFRLEDLAAADAQATLAALTASSIADAITRHCPRAVEVLVCGGGARNATLIDMLADRLAPRSLRPTDAAGLPAALVEAVAFAWLAKRAIDREPGNLPAVTGARGERVLGAVWPA